MGRVKLLLRCVCSAAREALGRPRGEERGGGISCRHAHSLLHLFSFYYMRKRIAALSPEHKNLYVILEDISSPDFLEMDPLRH